MPTKMGIAMSEDIGSPQCGSLGVICSLEFDNGLPTLPNLQTLQHVVDGAVVPDRSSATVVQLLPDLRKAVA